MSGFLKVANADFLSPPWVERVARLKKLGLTAAPSHIEAIAAFHGLAQRKKPIGDLPSPALPLCPAALPANLGPVVPNARIAGNDDDFPNITA